MTPVLAPRRLLPWLLLALALGYGGWVSWRLWRPEPAPDVLGTTLTAFSRQNHLTVFSAQLAPVVASQDSRLFGILKSRQVAVIPARVDYTVELSTVDTTRLEWNPAIRRLAVRLPSLRLSAPDLDEARAQYLREGVWITGTAQETLTRANTQAAARQAATAAAVPALMTLARTAARDAVRQNLEIPFAAAGYGDVRVEVRFDGEPAPK